MSHYLVLLIFKFLPARLATLPYGLDSNVTQLLANTERIACILCMHLGACRCFTHPTGLITSKSES